MIMASGSFPNSLRTSLAALAEGALNISFFSSSEISKIEAPLFFIERLVILKEPECPYRGDPFEAGE